MIVMIVAVLLVAGILAFSYLILTKNNKTKNATDQKAEAPQTEVNNTVVDNTPAVPEGSPFGKYVTGSASPNRSSGSTIKDCQNDINCLIQASSACSTSKATIITSMDILGLKETMTTYYEIRGLKTDKCVLYIETKNINLVFPPSVPLETANKQKELYKKLEGRNGECKFNVKDLTATLANWKAGNYDTGNVTCKMSPQGEECTSSDGDFAKATCSGSYFQNTI